jgi:hypothetical protein
LYGMQRLFGDVLVPSEEVVEMRSGVWQTFYSSYSLYLKNSFMNP